MPINFIRGSGIVFQDEIHLLGTNDTTNGQDIHYAFNGSSWRSVGTLPQNSYDTSVAIHDNKIHLLGGALSSSHYSYDGTSWKQEA